MANIFSFMATGNGTLQYFGADGGGTLVATAPVKYQPTLCPVPANPVNWIFPGTSLAGQNLGGADTATLTGPDLYGPLPGARINLQPNPSVEGTTSGYVQFNSTITNSSDWSLFGAQSLKCTATATVVTWGAVTANNAAGYAKVVPGQTYTASGYFYHGNSGPRQFYIGIYFYDATGIQVGAPVSPGAYTMVQPFTATRIAITAVANAGAQLSRLVLYSPGALQAVGDTFYVDGLLYEQAATALPYFDASMTNDGKWMDPLTGLPGTAHQSPSVEHAGTLIWEGTTNLVPNPGAEVDVTTEVFVVTGGTLTRDTTRSFYGVASNKMVTPGSAALEGFMYRALITSTGAANGYVGQVQVRGSGTVQVSMRVNYSDVTLVETAPVVVVLTDAWQRVVTPLLTLDPAKTTQNFWLMVRSPTAVPLTFNVDAGQIEQKPYATPFCSGDMGAGFTWAGTANASQSTRANSVIKQSIEGRVRSEQGSVCGWYYPLMQASSNHRDLFAVGAPGSARDFLRMYWTGSAARLNMSAMGSSPVDTATSPVITPTDKVFFYGEWTPTSIAVSANGAAKTTVARTAPNGDVSSSAQITVGSYPIAANFCDGVISDIQLFDRPLYPEDVAALYADGPAMTIRIDRLNGRYPELPRVNLLVNPRFAVDVANWTLMGAGTTLVQATDADFVGGTCCRVTCVALTTAGIMPHSLTGSAQLTSVVPMNGRGSVTFSFDAKWISGGTDYFIAWKEYDLTGAEVLSGAGPDITLTPTVQRFTTTYTSVTTGMTRCLPQLRRKTATVGTFRISNCLLEPSTQYGLTRYFDGADGLAVFANPFTGMTGAAWTVPSINQVQFFPEGACTNLVPNPSMEATTLDWTATFSGTVAKSTVYAYLGATSCEITWPTALANQAVGGVNVSGLTIGTVYTCTAYVRVPAGHPDVRITVATIGYGDIATIKDQWVRLTETFTATATIHNVGIVAYTTPTAGQKCYVDCVQVEARAWATSYVDGTLGTGYSWTGTAHASTSSRAAFSPKVANANSIVDTAVGSVVARNTPNAHGQVSPIIWTAGLYANTPGDYLAYFAVSATAHTMHGTTNASAASGINSPAGYVWNAQSLLGYGAWDRSTIRVAVDAQPSPLSVARAPVPAGYITTNNQAMQIGAIATGATQWYEGGIGPVAVASRPLTDNERTRIRRRVRPWTLNLLPEVAGVPTRTMDSGDIFATRTMDTE